jgi:hypothetical protein
VDARRRRDRDAGRRPTTPVEALAAAMHRAWPVRPVGRDSGGPSPTELAARTVLAGLDGWTLVPESDLARLQVLEDAVATASASLGDVGMVQVDDGGWVVSRAGREKLERTMDLLAGLAKKP